jgi:hypothetical protein
MKLLVNWELSCVIERDSDDEDDRLNIVKPAEYTMESSSYTQRFPTICRNMFTWNNSRK